MGMVSIPIMNDTIVEGNEGFDVALQAGSNGIVIGTPGQSVVTIIDYNDGKGIYALGNFYCMFCVVVKVMFEEPMYNVSKPSRRVEVCLLKTGANNIPVTVQLQPAEEGSAEAGSAEAGSADGMFLC